LEKENVLEDDQEMNRDGAGSGNAVGRENGDVNSRIGDKSSSTRPAKFLSWKQGERGDMEGLGRIMGSEVEGVRFSTSNYPDEGPSSCSFDDSYSFGQQYRNHEGQDGANGLHGLEQDRAELLRKLDELKEQLSRSCDVADKTQDKAPRNGRMVPPDPYGASSTWFPGGCSTSDRTSMQFLTPDKHTAGPPYFNRHPDPFPYHNRHEMATPGLHPTMHKPNHIPGYGDPFGSQMMRRVSHQLPAQYQQPPRQYFSGHYFDTNPDPFEPYPSSASIHPPLCSCFHCYEKHHGVPPAALYNRRFPDVPNNPMMCHHENPGAFGPHVSCSRTSGPPLNLRASQYHTRWPSDLNPDMGGFVHSRPRRVVLSGSGRCCRPIAGGAPFLTCFNCFELLQLPKKLLVLSKSNKKIRCGACSTVINFAVVNKKLVLTANSESLRIPAEVDDSSNELLKHANVDFSSDDYDNSAYDFQTIDADPVVSSTEQDINSSNPQEMQRFHSSSPSTSGDENSPDVLIAPRQVMNSIQQPTKTTPSPLPPGSPLPQHFDLSSANHVTNRLGKGNRSSRSDQEKVITSKGTTRQNSMKEASLATEMDVPFHEYCNTGVSQDSGDGSKEDSQSKTTKGGESFLANIIKKSFKDFSRTNQPDERSRNSVSVNGHIIPERLVKKAEKRAGPIHPGQYWYDFQAGFWGAMGGPCLGIIPPFIEELKYAMPENCSGGKTGVFVNGRELHQKDFDLLVGRGLPTERNRYYVVDISGRVLDEDTGEELDSLGRLAPTVEKVKHGFGMKVPKAAAS
ncbi:hypothetical protein Tsubulata_041748, partial [Turnera subulata]